jgi:hypothetical protein
MSGVSFMSGVIPGSALRDRLRLSGMFSVSGKALQFFFSLSFFCFSEKQNSICNEERRESRNVCFEMRVAGPSRRDARAGSLEVL